MAERLRRRIDALSLSFMRKDERCEDDVKMFNQLYAIWNTTELRPRVSLLSSQLGVAFITMTSSLAPSL